MNAPGARRYLVALAAALLALPAAAQDRAAEPSPLHWSFAAAVGSGYYRVGDNDIYFLHLPLSGELARIGDGNATLEWILPLSLGSVQFEEFFDEGVLPTELGVLTALPGVRLQFQAGPDWHLTPSVMIGRGWARGLPDATIVGGVVTGRRAVPLGDSRVSLGLGAEYYGYRDEDGERDEMARWSLGLDLVTPLPWSWNQERLYFKGYLVYRRYHQRDVAAPFYARTDSATSGPLTYEWDLALALGFARDMRVLGLPLERAGLALSRSDFHGAYGIKLVASFPF